MEKPVIWNLFFNLLTGFGITCCTRIETDLLQSIAGRIETLQQENLELRNEVINSNVHYQERIAELRKEQQRLEETNSTDIPDSMKNNPKRMLLATYGRDNLVAFTAALDTLIKHQNNGTTIVFNKVLTNLGGAYNASNGTFVAPAEGVYMVSCSLLDSHLNNTALRGDILVNDDVQARIYAHSSLKRRNRYRDQGAQNIFVHMKRNDILRIRYTGSDDGEVDGQLYSTFSAHLLRPN